VSLEAFGLKEKAILVTGASRGIGRGIALELGKAKAWVGITFTGASASSEANARKVCEEIETAGGRALAMPLDLAVEEQITATLDTFMKAFGRMDGLVNNAGIVIDQLTMRYKTEDFDKLMAVNSRGTFLITKGALRPLMKAGGASIVNMSSIVGEMGNAGQIPYCMSKAAIIGMTLGLAREVSSRQVRVNAIAPGFITTDMTDQLTPEQKNTFESSIPLGRMGEVQDIASSALFLLSPLSSYITGQVLSVNGGLYM